MRRSASALCALILTAGLAAPAMAQAPSPDAAAKPAAGKRDGCFFADNIRGYQVVDDKTVNVEIRRGEVYQLKLFYAAFDLDTSLRIGIKARSSWVCSPLDASIIIPESMGPHSYPLQAIRRLTPEEVAEAYPPLKKKAPKS